MKGYKYLLILFFLFCFANVFGQDVRFVIDAANEVGKGERFHLDYILENGKGSDLEVPSEIKGFDVQYGPAISQSSSISIVNGKRSSKSSITYTYTLMAKEEGTFTLPEAIVKVDGKTYKSGTASIKVMPPDKNAQSQQSGGQQPQMTSSTSTAEKINEDDVFVRAIFSRTKVKEQEAVVVTFRFYSALNIAGFVDAQFPEFEGFMVEDMPMPVNIQTGVENFKGRNYYTIDFKKTLLFPQRSGKLTIPSGSVTVVLVVPSGKQVRTFFGVQTIPAEVEKTLKTSPVTVEVSKLPDGKPLNFSGGVGTFDLKSTLSADKVKANDAVTLKLEISGVGNMKLIKNPTLELDKNIEVYDEPKVNNNFKVTTNGLTGYRTIEYLLIPRYPGQYKIPEIELSYYDTSSGKYKTLKTSAYELEVDKDPNAGQGASATSYINQQEVKVDKDIRYLKTGDKDFKNYSDYFIGSLVNVLCYVIPSLLFFVFLIVYRKQIKANADIARMRTKKANKVASKRLKQANKFLKNNERDKFYEESLRAVWGYLSDKLTIPVSALSRENVEAELRNYGVEDTLIQQFISVIDTCEFARYAPSSSESAMGNLYDEMVSIIGKMESVIKIK